jgi:hypothetical protein
MGRPRKPTHLLLLGGAAKKHPERMKGRAERGKDGAWKELEDSPEGVGDPPAYFDEEQKVQWHEFLATVPAGVLRLRDRPTVIELAKLLAESRRGTISSSDRKLLMGLLPRFGADPSSRSKAPGTAAKGSQTPTNRFGTV